MIWKYSVIDLKQKFPNLQNFITRLSKFVFSCNQIESTILEITTLEWIANEFLSRMSIAFVNPVEYSVCCHRGLLTVLAEVRVCRKEVHLPKGLPTLNTLEWISHHNNEKFIVVCWYAFDKIRLAFKLPQIFLKIVVTWVFAYILLIKEISGKI